MVGFVLKLIDRLNLLNPLFYSLLGALNIYYNYNGQYLQIISKLITLLILSWKTRTSYMYNQCVLTGTSSSIDLLPAFYFYDNAY